MPPEDELKMQANAPLPAFTSLVRLSLPTLRIPCDTQLPTLLLLHDLVCGYICTPPTHAGIGWPSIASVTCKRFSFLPSASRSDLTPASQAVAGERYSCSSRVCSWIKHKKMLAFSMRSCGQKARRVS